MIYIKRHIERQLLSNFKTIKCLALLGARQVGKTTTLEKIFVGIKRINMKDPELQSKAKSSPTSFLKSYPMPLIIDEIQEAPYLLNSIKVILDEKKEYGNYIFSGSQKWEMMKGLSDSLAGMVSIVELPTLSVREILNIDFNKEFSLDNEYLDNRSKKIKKYENIWELIHRGFYPELYNGESRDWEKFYSDYIRTYIERDVYKIINIKDSTLFYKFLVSIASRTGSILNVSNIAEDIGVKSDTISSWISILEKTNIIYLLEPYYNSHLNRAIKSPKIYFRDTGLCAYLSGWMTPYQLENGNMNGNFFKTFIVGEIIKSYLNNGKDYRHYIYYYRSKDKYKNSNGYVENEIDLIIEKNNTLYPLEIKKTKNPTSKMAKAFKDLNKDFSKKRGEGAIICCCEDKILLENDLIALPIEYI